MSSKSITGIIRLYNYLHVGISCAQLYRYALWRLNISSLKYSVSPKRNLILWLIYLTAKCIVITLHGTNIAVVLVIWQVREKDFDRIKRYLHDKFRHIFGKIL